MKEVAIAILNWNGRKHLEEFLPSVIENHQPEKEKIYVIDNASTDDSVAFLEQRYPQVEIIHNQSNGGYARGYNEGLKSIAEPFYILLNSDVEVSMGWSQKLLEAMKNDSQLAGCQPLVMDYKNKAFFEHAGAAGGFIDRFGYPFCRGRIFNELEVNSGQYNHRINIFWATGACLMIRADLFKQSGGFDEDFFAHMEEIDLCWRLKNQGYKFACIPESKVYHLGGGTLSVISPNKTFLNFRNNLFLLHKNLPDKFLFRVLIIRFLFDIAAVFHFLISKKTSHAAAVIKAWKKYFKAIGILKNKRKILASTLAPDYLSGVYKQSLVFDFYFRKKRKFSDLNADAFSSEE